MGCSTGDFLCYKCMWITTVLGLINIGYLNLEALWVAIRETFFVTNARGLQYIPFVFHGQSFYLFVHHLSRLDIFCVALGEHYAFACFVSLFIIIFSSTS